MFRCSPLENEQSIEKDTFSRQKGYKRRQSIDFVPISWNIKKDKITAATPVELSPRDIGPQLFLE